MGSGSVTWVPAVSGDTGGDDRDGYLLRLSAIAPDYPSSIAPSPS